jgi:hypothetical protein
MNAAANACRNCETPHATEQRFCGACGQRTGAERLTMRHIGHEIVHALTHADHSVFALIRQLVYRPGHVAREYVEGKRKKYFSPFTFLVIVVGLASFMIVITGVQFFGPTTDSGAGGFLQRHVNLVILLQMPLIAGWSALLFWPSRLNYAEHLVLAACTAGIRIMFLALITTPIMYFTKLSPSDPAVVPLYTVLWLIYFSVAAVQFYRGNVYWTIVRAVVAAVLANITTIYAIVLFTILFSLFAAH